MGEVSQSTNYDTSKLVYFDFNLSGTVAFLRNSVLEMGSAAPNTFFVDTYNGSQMKTDFLETKSAM